MKKETIFKHEINESIQANAAMNCLKNRNKPQQMNEALPLVAGALRLLMPLLRPLITKLVKSLVMKAGAKLTGRQVAKMVIKNVSNGKTLMKIGKKVGQTWTELPAELKQEIAKTAINTFKEMRKPQQPQLANQEQEESVDYAQLADDVCASYRGPLSKLDLKDSINYIVNMVAKKIGKTVDALTPQELTAIQKAAKHSVWYVSEQEEDTLNAYYSQDEPDYENDHHGIWLIINLMRKMGMLRAQGIEGRDNVDDGHAIDAAYDLIEQKLNSEGMWIGDDDHEAERFVSFFGEEIAEEAMKSAIHNQEQEELPSMERHDMILALSEYMSESWIATGDDGDLDDIYYAVAEILDKTGDYPASTSWEDCKPWCQKHYREVEAKIY